MQEQTRNKVVGGSTGFTEAASSWIGAEAPELMLFPPGTTAASRAVKKWLRLTAPEQDSRLNLPLTTCGPLLIQLLIAAAAAAGLSVTHSDPRCAENPMLMGGWNREQTVVFLCAASIQAQGMDQEEILRHELIHVIQDLHQGALLPEPLFSILARETIPSGEVMMVIASGDDANRELELPSAHPDALHPRGGPVAHGIGREEPAGSGHPCGPGAEESLSGVPSSLEGRENRLQSGLWIRPCLPLARKRAIAAIVACQPGYLLGPHIRKQLRLQGDIGPDHHCSR